MCSVWMPLSAVAAIDSLELIAGSHRWGKQYLPIQILAPDTTTLAGDPENLPPGVDVLPDIEAQRDQHQILACGHIIDIALRWLMPRQWR